MDNPEIMATLKLSIQNTGQGEAKHYTAQKTKKTDTPKKKT